MKPTIPFPFPVIQTDTGSLLFNRIYLLAFIMVVLLFFLEGRRRKIPADRLLLALSSFLLFFILGSRIFGLSAADWDHLATDGTWPLAVRKTMLGGIAGLVAGLVIYVRWLRGYRQTIDLAAFVIPFGMIVQRIGCLLAGCCFGTPTDLAWGIRYGEHSHAWQSQVAGGAILPCDIHSLPVHPVQIYDMICWVLILLVVLQAGKYLRSTGNRLLLTAALYGFFRFLTEFVRDPANDFFPGYFLGIKYVQWAILAALPLVIMLIILRERKARSTDSAPVYVTDPAWRTISFTFLLALLFFLTKGLYDMTEKIALLSLLTPLFLHTTWQLFREATVPGFRLATSCLALCLVLFSGQSYFPSKPGEKVKYMEITLGGTTGVFYNTYQRIREQSIYHPGDCKHPGYYTYEYNKGPQHSFRQESWLGGLDIQAKQNRMDHQVLSAGAGLYVGEVVGTVSDSSFTDRHFTFVINPSFSYDWPYFGVKGGIYIGQFYFISKEYQGEDAYDKDGHTGELHPYYVFPQGSIRLGVRNILFMEVSLADHFPQGSPLWPISIGLGSGLGKFDGTRVAAGYVRNSLYADCYLPVKDKIVLRGSVSTNFKGGTSQLWSASFGIGFRFGYFAGPSTRQGTR